MCLKKYLIDNNISFEENTSLRKKTWLKTGGIVSLWITPQNIDELKFVLHYISANSISYQIVGHTSNIFYLDTTNPRVIVNTKQLKGYVLNGTTLLCNCGVPVASLSKEMVSLGYKGFSGLVNLPGTVGAAIVNNSSCFDCSISDLVESIVVFDMEAGREHTLSCDELKYSYRSSVLKRKEMKAVVLSVKLRLIKGFVEEEVSKADEATYIRIATQEKPAYTLGSVFANLEERKSFGLKIYRRYLRLLTVLKLINKPSHTQVLLNYYRYLDLEPFVSKKNVNTFIWRPEIENKEATFNRYCDFMHQAFIDPCLEIEIR